MFYLFGVVLPGVANEESCLLPRSLLSCGTLAAVSWSFVSINENDTSATLQPSLKKREGEREGLKMPLKSFIPPPPSREIHLSTEFLGSTLTGLGLQAALLLRKGHLLLLMRGRFWGGGREVQLLLRLLIPGPPDGSL